MRGFRTHLFKMASYFGFFVGLGGWSGLGGLDGLGFSSGSGGLVGLGFFEGSSPGGRVDWGLSVAVGARGAGGRVG